MAEREAAVAKGELFGAGRQKLSELLDEWLEIVAATRRATTFQGYRWYCRKYILPELGHIALKDIQPSHLQRFYSGMVGSGLSSSTTAQAHRILHRAFNHAVKLGLAVRNPADAATPPKVRRKETKTLSVSDVQIFVEAARRSSFYPVFVTLIWTGARRSEVLGLMWKDVDTLLGTISIRRAMHVLKGGEVLFQEPKSRAGQRSIAMPPTLNLALAEHRAVMERIRGPLQEDDLVFTWEDGRPMRPLSVSHAFRRIARRAGLKGVRLHDIRHSHATILLEQGVHPKVVSERLGHSGINITLDLYSHVAPGIQQAAAAAFDKALSPVHPRRVETEKAPLTIR